MGGGNSKLESKVAICTFLSGDTVVQFSGGDQKASEYFAGIVDAFNSHIDHKGSYQGGIEIASTGNVGEIGTFMTDLAMTMFGSEFVIHVDYVAADQILSFCLKRNDTVAGCWFQIQGNLFKVAINVPLDRPSTSTANGPSQSSGPPDTAAAPNSNVPADATPASAPTDAAPASAPPMSAMYAPRSSLSAELLRMEALVDRVSAAMRKAI